MTLRRLLFAFLLSLVVGLLASSVSESASFQSIQFEAGSSSVIVPGHAYDGGSDFSLAGGSGVGLAVAARGTAGPVVTVEGANTTSVPSTDATEATVVDESVVGGWRGTNMSAPQSFGYHYAAHGAGMTEAEYDAAAQAWAQAPTGVSKSIQLADGSWATKWQTPGGGPGGIVDANGNIITYWTK